MFEETVQGHQHVYDQIMANGQNLHRVSHPKAEPIIAGQLQQLQQKWKQLKGKIHSRSEVLESLLLEIHGLQDSIDELSKWVGSAEEDLTNAEEMPIGEDMDSVETQLNYHEVRMISLYDVILSHTLSDQLLNDYLHGIILLLHQYYL